LLSAESGIPNPFTISTSIAYRLTSVGHVKLSVFDLRGRRVAVLEDAQRAPGTNVVTWDGHVEGGRQAPAGLYFIRIELPGRIETRRVVRLR
jgi:flagellar hook assembly protein FlgD